ncbi:hypothetical protein [Sphingobacterium faecium]|uniref:hypothetical protein n=1 Tax=Sphingobacterium faecium TaxID=34087 RepID=UPI001292B458|nr:hypothetical protein [Sphingobacterium faecium]
MEEIDNQNLLASTFNSSFRAKVYAFVRVDMKLLDSASRKISVVNNEATDCD